jgi:signal transduction histidine kinase
MSFPVAEHSLGNSSEPLELGGNEKEVNGRQFFFNPAVREASSKKLETVIAALRMLNRICQTMGQSLELDALLIHFFHLAAEEGVFSRGVIFLDSAGPRSRAVAYKINDAAQQSIWQYLNHPVIQSQLHSPGALHQSCWLRPALEDAPTLIALPLKQKELWQGTLCLLAEAGWICSESARAHLSALGKQLAWAIYNSKTLRGKLPEPQEKSEIDQTKLDFVAMVSHELRTPLTSILGFLSYAGMAMETQDDNRLTRYIQVALENAHKLAVMVDDLLTMQKLDSGTLRLVKSPVDLRDLMDEIAVDLQPHLDRREQRLRLNIPADLPLIHADRTQLERVISNLILNAAKFSSGPDSIEIGAELISGKQRIRFSVRDHGIGMSEALQQKIFEPFFQGEASMTRSVGGVGLGLTIAKHVVELHGGKLWVESAPRAGSLFFFEIPCH